MTCCIVVQPDVEAITHHPKGIDSLDVYICRMPAPYEDSVCVYVRVHKLAKLMELTESCDAVCAGNGSCDWPLSVCLEKGSFYRI